MGGSAGYSQQRDKRRETMSARQTPVLISSVGLLTIRGQKDVVTMTR